MGNQYFYFDYHDGSYGYNTSSSRGADTFFPFSSGGIDINSAVEISNGTGDFTINNALNYKLIAVSFIAVSGGWTNSPSISFTNAISSPLYTMSGGNCGAMRLCTPTDNTVRASYTWNTQPGYSANSKRSIVGFTS